MLGLASFIDWKVGQYDVIRSRPDARNEPASSIAEHNS